MVIAVSKLLIVSSFFLLIAAKDLNVQVPNFNAARSAFAKKAKVANMHALTFHAEESAFLEKALNEELKDCSVFEKDTGEKPPDIPGRFVPIVSGEKAEEFLAAAIIAMAKDPTLPTLLNLELLMHPLQTDMACAEFRKKCPIHTVIGDLIMEGLCIMGPAKTFAFTDYVSGEPGTACGGLKSRDGLCLVSGRDIVTEGNEEEGLAAVGAKKLPGGEGLADAIASKGSKSKGSSAVAVSSDNEISSSLSLPSPFALSLCVLFLAQFAFE